MQARKHTNTQTDQACKHLRTQARQARKHASTPARGTQTRQARQACDLADSFRGSTDKFSNLHDSTFNIKNKCSSFRDLTKFLIKTKRHLTSLYCNHWIRLVFLMSISNGLNKQPSISEVVAERCSSAKEDFCFIKKLDFQGIWFRFPKSHS